MKRMQCVLLDEIGRAQARMTIPESGSVELEPWMIFNITHRGWRLVTSEADDSGIEIHGWADWQSIADDLAVSLEAILRMNRPKRMKEADKQILEHARQALDDYRVAQMEVSIVTSTGEREDDDDG